MIYRFIQGCVILATIWVVPRPIVAIGQSAASFTIVDVGALGGRRSAARDINAAGRLVGRAETADGKMHAFIYADGVMQDLGTFGGAFSIANRITDSDVVVGRAEGVDGRQQPFIMKHGSQLLNPVAFGQQLHGSFGEVLGVNDAGQAVGYFTTAGAHMAARNRVFLYEDVLLKDLGTFGGHDGVVTGINRHGHLVGYVGTDQHADYSDQLSFLVTARGVTMLPSLGGRTTTALGLNDDGDVVGHAQLSGGDSHAFLYRAGKMVDLGALPGGVQSFAYAISPTGRIVGAAEGRDGSLRAVFFEAGRVVDLNTLISDTTWVLTEARASNVKGQIVGTGIHDGVERAFLLNPHSSP